MSDYSTKMCPLLTSTSLRNAPEPSRIVGAGGTPTQTEPEAVGCQGPACALFVPIANEKGEICGGGCAVTLLPTALGQIKNSLDQAAVALRSFFSPKG